MKRLLPLFIILLSGCSCLFAQDSLHTVSILVKNADKKNALAGATVTIDSLNRTVVADSSGLAIFTNVPKGSFYITVTFIGFEEQKILLNVPQPSIEPFVVFLEEGEEHHEEEVFVTATRLSRTIANIPTRIEVLSGEELAEKGNMRPGNLQMLLKRHMPNLDG